ncbi:hypothetical protein E2C01_044204 [Portunus trituberculatus]|uniref:Uncharacterized protein n=1 Tax=Portunus trituberculatus TaxID=210409 RepID=A0A5B7FXS0_PORTR|nr:hypothetical protein [Portunus trituberculatus]
MRARFSIGGGAWMFLHKRGRSLMEEVTALLNKGTVDRLFVVPKVKGGFCLIIDLSFLNQRITTMKFKMETICMVLAAVR